MIESRKCTTTNLKFGIANILGEHRSNDINVTILSSCGSSESKWQSQWSNTGRRNNSIEFVNNGSGIRNPLADIRHSVSPLTIQFTHGNEENVWTCPKCEKTFINSRIFNRHIKSHSKIRKYLCKFCFKGFNDRFDLKRHTRTHTGVRPYQCPSCIKAFTQRCSLESHLQKLHNIALPYGYKERREKMHICEECGFSSTKIENFWQHMSELHPFIFHNDKLEEKLLF